MTKPFAPHAGVQLLRRAALVVSFLSIALLSGCGDATTNDKPPIADPPPQTREPAAQPAPGQAPESTNARPSAAKAEIGLANADNVKQLLADAKGKVVVINVWATFCIPCIEEMPELAQFYKERDPKRVEFISLSADPAYSIEDAVKPFAAEMDLPFPIHVLDELPPDDLLGILGAESTGWDGALPATFILDSSGAIKKFWLERVHLKDLTAAVTEMANA